VRHYTFDPAKARVLLEQAGWKIGRDGIRSKNGQRLALTIAGIANSATGDAVSIVAQANWKAVGIETFVKTFSSSLYFASYGGNGILQTGKFDIAFYSWVNGVDPDDSVQFMCDQFRQRARTCTTIVIRPSTVKSALRSAATTVRCARKPTTKRSASGRRTCRRSSRGTRGAYRSRIDLRGYRPAHAVTSFWNPYDWSI